MMRFSGLQFILVALLCVGFSMSAARADTLGAKGFVEGLTVEVIGVLQKDAGNKPAIRKALYDVFYKSVDVEWVGNFVLGKYRRQTTTLQQADFRKIYADFMVLNYANRFSEYSGEQTKTLNSSGIGTGEYLVQTQILRPNQPQPVKVDYRVREAGGKYLIYDVVIEGVSMLNSQRSEFASVISRKGFDFLLERMQARVKALSAQ